MAKRSRTPARKGIDELRVTCLWAAFGDCAGQCHCAEAIALREAEEQAAAEALANSRRKVADQIAKATLNTPARSWRDADSVLSA